MVGRRKAVCIIGLPGSGKTYLAQSVFVPHGYVLIDDPKEVPVFDPRRNYVICDPWLCDPQARRYANEILSKTHDVSCIYFENNIEKCEKRIAKRNDGRVIKDLWKFNYIIPEGVDIYGIYDGDL